MITNLSSTQRIHIFGLIAGKIEASSLWIIASSISSDIKVPFKYQEILTLHLFIHSNYVLISG